MLVQRLMSRVLINVPNCDAYLDDVVCCLDDVVFFFGTQRRRSHISLPVLALIFLACFLVSSHLLRDSLRSPN